MDEISQRELQRQFRVLDQMLSMHNTLSNRFSTLSLILDISLLSCAVVFCATTFIGDDFFAALSLTPHRIKIMLGMISVLAFLASIVSLRVDWKGKHASHKEASQKLAIVLARYRELRSESGEWPLEKSSELNQKYWAVMSNIPTIPERSFAALKAKHLRKVEISRLLDSHPGCPLFLLRFFLLRNSMKDLGSRTREL
jgi:hypothetical protein